MGDKSVRVQVHLSYDLDAASWQQRYSTGLVPDKTPYGYHHATEWACRVSFSKSLRESKVVGLLRRAMGRFMGFDLLHAWRNRKQMREAQAIWTHTEREYLSILLLRRWRILPPSTPLIAQSIWLFDIWARLPRWKQRWYRWLIQNDARTVLTVLSDVNLEVARTLFPNMRSEQVHFGISLDSFPLKAPTVVHDRVARPLRVLSLGNDVHRDWETLIGAVKASKGIELRIATNLSYKWNRALESHAAGSSEIRIEPAKSLEAVHEAYEWADIVVVPLIPNKHASGLTVVLETITAGKPVIATDTGGLRSYFDDSEVYYVPVGDVEALAAALKKCADKADKTFARVKNAQAKLLSHELTTKGFASKHVRLTEDLLYSEVGVLGR